MKIENGRLQVIRGLGVEVVSRLNCVKFPSITRNMEPLATRYEREALEIVSIPSAEIGRSVTLSFASKQFSAQACERTIESHYPRILGDDLE